MAVLAQEVVVLVAGARAAAVHDVLTALLPGRRRLPYTPRSTYVVLHGASRSGNASFACLSTTGTGVARPLRRVELALTDPLLDRLTLVGVRAVPATRGHHAQLVTELVSQSESVIMVTDGRNPYQPAEIDLLRSAEELGKGIFFAVTHADENSAWADVVLTNQATLARELPALALRPWHPVSRSGSSVLELRDSVLAWSRARRRPSRRRAPAIRVAPDAAGSGWRDLLRLEVDRAHDGATACVQRELTRLRAGIDDETLDVAEFDRRLRVLSAALAAQTRASVDAALATVLRPILACPPDRDVIDRVSVALQRDVAERCCGASTCLRALRVTATAAAAIATAREALAPTGHPFGPPFGQPSDQPGGVLPPLSIGLTANCVPRPGGTAGVREQAWLARALDSLTLELDRELARQFTYLGQAAADLIVDGLDHDLLLV